MSKLASSKYCRHSHRSQLPHRTGAGDSVDTRLARIEAKLDTLRGVDGGTSFDQFFGLDAPGGRVTGISIDPKLIHTPLSTQWPGPTSRDGPPVPPLTEALPLIELFFQNYNSLIPLFDQQSFVSNTLVPISHLRGISKQNYPD